MNEIFLERDRVGNSQTIALYKHGAHFKPHLEAMAASDASSNTSEKKKMVSFHAHTLWFGHLVLQAWMYHQRPIPALSLTQI